MTAKALVPYRKQQVPTLDPTLSAEERLYYDQQLTAIQKSLTALIGAVQQLQTDVVAASAFPIVLT